MKITPATADAVGSTLLFLAGSASVCYGLALLSGPAAWIFAGVTAVVVAAWPNRGPVAKAPKP